MGNSSTSHQSRKPGPKKRRPQSPWRELRDSRELFQDILSVIVEYTEATNQQHRSVAAAGHYMRKAVVFADPEHIRIFLRTLPDHDTMFYVIADVSLPSGNQLTASWLHEDSLTNDRALYREDPAHRVHSITCLTDLYDSPACKPTSPAKAPANVQALMLLEDDE